MGNERVIEMWGKSIGRKISRMRSEQVIVM